MSVEQFGESGGSRRQVETDLRQNGVGKTVKIVNTNYSFRKFGYKEKREGGSYLGIYNLQISISGSRFTLPTVRCINELLS